MRVLVIDDEPIRAMPVLAAGHDVKIAHGHEQVKFWSSNKYWIPELICLDHDMPLMNGKDILRVCGEDLIPLDVPIRVWTRNNVAWEHMLSLIRDICVAYKLDRTAEDFYLPFDLDNEEDFWSSLR